MVVPALNEEDNIQAAIKNVIEAVSGHWDDYEVLVMNDGSTDRTGVLAEEMAKNNPKIRVVHNERNLGYGTSYRKAVGLASKEYISIFAGDNEISAMFLRDFLPNLGDVDFVTSYPSTTHKRVWLRRFLSKTFINTMNFIFRLKLRCYTGAFVYRVSLVRSIPIKSDGLMLLPECLVRLIKAGHRFRQVPFEYIGRKGGKSTALSSKNLLGGVRVLLILMKDIYFQ